MERGEPLGHGPPSRSMYLSVLHSLDRRTRQSDPHQCLCPCQCTVSAVAMGHSGCEVVGLPQARNAHLSRNVEMAHRVFGPCGCLLALVRPCRQQVHRMSLPVNYDVQSEDGLVASYHPGGAGSCRTEQD
ncbi:hypothetical protein NDU88_001593 [Pleurodeles waltl]|uniref:Uncharacterized protein n=1 Tax=Pleurodeles waltl TaxID=8319 RepID=A0AAV7P4G5_PLEWA|nr:hypothetical protein NDU88_001593 [Pleurodeles waltl]